MSFESSQAICESSQVRSTPEKAFRHSPCTHQKNPLIFGYPHIVSAKSPGKNSSVSMKMRQIPAKFIWDSPVKKCSQTCCHTSVDPFHFPMVSHGLPMVGKPVICYCLHEAGTTANRQVSQNGKYFYWFIIYFYGPWLPVRYVK